MKWFDRLSEREKSLFGWSVILLMLTPFIAWFSFNYLNSQQRNMRAVDRYIESIEPLVEHRAATDPAFRNIRLVTFTGSNGSFMVTGEVATEEERERIRQLFRETPPPRPLYFDVLLPTEQYPFRSLKGGGS